MEAVTLSRIAARRFILGKQGLWPGRRWKGKRGVESAMRAMEYLQLDPLQVLARSQDLALHSRVVDYIPGLWEDAVTRNASSSIGVDGSPSARWRSCRTGGW